MVEENVFKNIPPTIQPAETLHESQPERYPRAKETQKKSEERRYGPDTLRENT